METDRTLPRDSANPRSAGNGQPSLKVFISYARADTVFADELAAGLEYDGRYLVMIDRQSIIEGEDWKRRLGALIADADTVVFILTETSAKSSICAWEVEEAHRHSKRILPVLAKSYGATPVPKQLAALNYVRFDPLEDGTPRSFMAGLAALARALNTDVAWLREHTRYLNLARSWEEAGSRANRLLSGSDIAAAKEWVARRPKDAPQPTDLHLKFIRASEVAEAERESAERMRLAEIEQAQKARAEALREAETAHAEKMAASVQLAQRTKIGIAVASTLMLLAGIFAFAAWTEHRRAVVQSETAQRESARADRFVNLVSSNPAGARVMTKTCSEAVDTTLTLATTTNKEEHDQASERFWELYYGPMYIIELHQRKSSGKDQSAIEAAMVRFGNALTGTKGEALPRSGLCQEAAAVRDACIAYLDLTSGKSC